MKRKTLCFITILLLLLLNNNPLFAQTNGGTGYIMVGDVNPPWYSLIIRSAFGYVDPYKELQPVIEKHRKRMAAMGLRVVYIETPSAHDVKKAITNPNTNAIAWFGHGDENVAGLFTTLAGEDITPGDIRSWAQERLSEQIGTPDTWKGLSPQERKARNEMWNNAHFDLKYVYMHTCYGLKDNSLPDVLTADNGEFWGYPEKAYLKDTSIKAVIRGGKPKPSNFDIKYDESAIRNHPKVGDGKWKKRGSSAELPTYSDSSSEPLFIQDMRYFLEVAFARYKEAGFETPSTPIVVNLVMGGSGDPGWFDHGNRQVNIRLPDKGITHSQLKHRTAHELFHAFQDVIFDKFTHIGPFSLEKKYARAYKWWLEATADYTPSGIVWKTSFMVPQIGHGNIEPKLLEYPLTYTGKGSEYDEDIEYDRAYFVKYLVEQAGANLKEMCEAIAKASQERWITRENGLEPLNKYLTGKTSKGLNDWYRSFAGYFFFSNSRPLKNVFSPDSSVSGSRMRFTLDENKSSLENLLFITTTDLKPEYTTILKAVDVDLKDEPKTTLTIASVFQSNQVLVDVYLLKSIDDPNDSAENYRFYQSPLPVVTISASNEIKHFIVEKGDVVFIVLTNGSPKEQGEARLGLSRADEGLKRYNLELVGPDEAFVGDEIELGINVNSIDSKGNLSPLSTEELERFRFRWSIDNREISDLKIKVRIQYEGENRFNVHGFKILGKPPKESEVEIGNAELVVKGIRKDYPPCTYNYSDWSPCDERTKKQTRTVISKSPDGCIEKDKPVLEKPCPPDAKACTYNYSDWSLCDETSKKQTRRVISKSPADCVEKEKPVLEQTCPPVKTEDPVETNFSGIRYENWDLAYDMGKKRLVMTRKPAKIKAPCGWDAYVTASLWIEFPKHSGNLKTSEDCTKLAKERFSKRRQGDTPNDMAVGLNMVGGIEGVQSFSIGDYKGAMADFALWMRRGSGSPMGGYARSYFGSNGDGCAIKRDRVIHFGYKVYGGGCWDNTDRAYLVSHGASAQQEARAILASLGLDTDGKISQEPYKGPKYDGSDLPKVYLYPDKLEKLKVGDKVKIQAVVENAKPDDSPFKYNWSGELDEKTETLKDSPTVVIKPKKPGKYRLSVSVDGARFNIGSDSLEYEVVDYKVKIERIPPIDTKPVSIGSTIGFKAMLTVDGKPATGNFIYRWQPHPEVKFSRLDSPLDDIIATFTKIGKVKVWVQVLEKKGEVLTTVAESEQIEIDAIQPKLKLGANKTDPLIGEKVVLTVHEEPKMSDKTITFWWEYSGNILNPGPEPNIPNSRAYSFKPKDTKPVTITVHAKAKDGGDDLGEAKITINPKSYAVAISEPRYHGPKPRIWKCDTQLGGACPGLVEVGDTQFAVFRDIFMKATVTPSPDSPRYKWTVDPSGSCGFPGSVSEIKINCSNTGTYTVKLEVTNADGAKLGEASTSVTISISQAQIDNSKKAKDAYDKFQKAKELVAQGKLDEGITLASEAAGLDSKNTEAKSLNDQWKMEREGIKQHITKLDQYIKDNKLADAEKELQAAQKLHPKYQPIIDAEKRLKEAKDKQDKIKKDAENKLNHAKNLVQQGKLDEAISLADEASKIDPSNNETKTLLEKWKNDLQGIKKHIVILEQLLKDNKLTEAEKELQSAQRINAKHQLVLEAENRLKAKKQEFNQKQAEAQRLKAEGEAFERQGKLQDAVNKYKESIKIIPDKALDDNIKRLEAEIAKDAQKKQTADKLWDECSSLAKQNKLSEALVKCKESLSHWSSDKRAVAVKEMEIQINQTNANKVKADRLWDECALLTKQSKNQEALSKCRESLSYWSSDKRVAAVKDLEDIINQESQKKATADRLWEECSSLAKQNRLQEALVKCKESLKYWSSDKRLAAVRDMEQQTNQANQKQEQCKLLMNEGYQLKQQGRVQDALAKYEEAQRICPNAETEQTISSIRNIITTSRGVEGIWEVSFNNYKGKMELQRIGSGWSGRLWLDAHRSWEQLTNISYSSSTGRLEFTRPISGATQRYSGTLSAERLDGTFTQENAPARYNWWAKRTQGGPDHTLEPDNPPTAYSPPPPKPLAIQWIVDFEYQGRSHVHDMYIRKHQSDIIEGNGGHPAGTPYTFAWQIKTGAIRGNRIEFVADYTLGAVGTTMHVNGTIATDGSMSGEWTDNYKGQKRRGTWTSRKSSPLVGTQTGTGNVISTETKKGKVIFDNGNTGGVSNTPTRLTTFTINQPHVITLIQNYHWNNARGSTPGTIALRDQSGRTYGPWQSKGLPGQGGVPNAYWNVHPNITIPAGTYTIIDSNPSTWAQNSGSQGAGFAKVEGYPVSAVGNQQIGGQVSGGTFNQPEKTIISEFKNSSSQNVHIFVEGQDSFGPHNRITPNETKKVNIKAPSKGGFITFNAGRNGQVLATCRWEYDPDTISGRVPVVTFNEPNRLSCVTGLR